MQPIAIYASVSGGTRKTTNYLHWKKRKNSIRKGIIPMNQDEYIKFLEERLKHSDEQLEKAMEMLAKLMSKMHKE
jgi:hypothetical protein